MKKLLSLVMLVASALSAAATPITINVDSSSRVVAGYNYKMWGFIDASSDFVLDDGENAIDVSASATSLYVKAAAGAQIDAVTVNGEPISSYENIAIAEGMVISVTSSELAADANINFSCDDFTLVRLSMRTDSSPRAIELTANECQIGIFPGDFALEVNSADAEHPILKVLMNGADAPYSWGSWVVEPIYDGINVQVITNEDNVTKYPVTFDFSDANARAYITAVAVDNSPVSDFESGLQLAAGAYVAMEVNSAITDVEVAVNGNVMTPNPLLGNISFNVEGETAVTVATKAVVPPVAQEFTVNIDHADYAKVGYAVTTMSPWGFPTTSTVYFDLTDGENIVPMPDGVTSIKVEAADAMHEVVSVAVNGAAVADYTNIPLEAGITLDVTSSLIAPVGYINLSCDNYTRVGVSFRTDFMPRVVTLESNESAIGFYAGESIMDLASLDSANPIVSVTVNGNPVAGSGSFMIEPLTDGMTVEVKTIPAMHNVHFAFDGDNARDFVTSVTVDGAEIPSIDTFEVAEGKSVTVNLNSAFVGGKISVNGIEQEPVTLPFGGMMFVVFDVNADTDVRVWVEAAEPPVDNTFTVDVDHAAKVQVGYKQTLPIPGLPPVSIPFELVDGDNSIEIPDGVTEIYVIPAEGHVIKTVAVDDTILSEDQYESIPLTPGMKLVITSDIGTDGIDAIGAAAEGARYFSLQGVELRSPASGTVCIKVQGGKAVKIVM